MLSTRAGLGPEQAARIPNFGGGQAHFPATPSEGLAPSPRPAHPGSCSPACRQATSLEQLRDYTSQHARQEVPPLRAPVRAPHAAQNADLPKLLQPVRMELESEGPWRPDSPCNCDSGSPQDAGGATCRARSWISRRPASAGVPLAACEG